MKSFLSFTFSFLYTRNWYTGQLELSRSKMAIFCGGVFLLVVSLFVISVLQAPIEVENPEQALQ
jgi:hypothetical protein